MTNQPILHNIRILDFTLNLSKPQGIVLAKKEETREQTRAIG